MSNDYSIDSIQSMEEIEHIRQRSGWYIGEAIDPRQLLSEVIDNSLDEAQNSKDEVSVTIEVDTREKPARYSVTDYGRGIPVGNKLNSKGEEVNSVEFLSTKTLSGAKFDNDTYKLRCLHEDTMIKLANGGKISIGDFYEKFNNTSEYLPLLSLFVIEEGEGNNSYDPIMTEATKCELTRIESSAYRIHLSNATYIDCTYDHRFYTANGDVVLAKDLKPGTGLLTMYNHSYYSNKDKILVNYSDNIVHDLDEIDYDDLYEVTDYNPEGTYADRLLDSWDCDLDILYTYINGGVYDQRIVTIPRDGDSINISVDKVEIVNYDTPQKFYDIQVSDSTPNFMLDNNILIHNSGLHGVGLCCCNALSQHYSITTRRDGLYSTFTSSRGEKLLSEDGNTKDSNGVTITFNADPEIFDSTTIPMHYITSRCEVAKAFGYNINLIVNGEVVEITSDKLSDLVPTDSSKFCEYENTSSIDTGESIKVYLSYTSDTGSNLVGYTNLLKNQYGGTHIRLLERAVDDVWWEYLKELDTPMKKSDARIGMKGVVAVFISHPSFSSQTKDKLTTKNNEIQPLIDKFAVDFKKYLDDNEEYRNALIDRFETYRLSQIRFTNDKLIMQQIKVNEVNETKNGKRQAKRKAIVRGLAECTSKDVEGTEIFLVEGNSAGEGLIRIRNSHTQAVLPLRGKIKNITWLDVVDALKSDDIKRIINSVGVGVGDNIDPDNCRYERINILADSDVDGCFTGDTKIKLANGLDISFEQLTEWYNSNDIGEESSLYTYSVDSSGKRHRTKIVSPRITKYVDTLSEIVLDSGDPIRCTEDHKWLLANGVYQPAKSLVVGDELSTISSNSRCKSNKVVSVNQIVLDKLVPVYDLTIPKYHNFCISSSEHSGVIVHNSHISNLIANVFIQLVPDLVKSGKVYVVQAPLYSYTLKKEKLYTNNFEDIPEELRLSKNFTRFKGLTNSSYVMKVA